jgi:hypothetical protein
MMMNRYAPEAILHRNNFKAVFAWCSATLLPFVLFFSSFPLDRLLPFWPYWNFVTIYSVWFVFVAPVTTLIALILFLKRKRRDMVLSTKWLIWITLIVTVLVNAFMVLGVYSFSV